MTSLPKIGTIMARSHDDADLRKYRIIVGTCPFCGRSVDIPNHYHLRYPPIDKIPMKCSEHGIDYQAKITKTKIVLFEIETVLDSESDVQ